MSKCHIVGNHMSQLNMYVTVFEDIDQVNNFDGVDGVVNFQLKL